MIGSKITNKITNVSRSAPQNNSGIVINEAENIGLDREIPRERHDPQKKTKLLMV